MQIVIDIDEECYKDCKTMAILSAEQGEPKLGYMYEKIADGIPLPKGHGDLIDRKELLKQSYRIDDSATLSTRDVVNEEEIDNAPPIIEADKTESEEI